MYRELEGYKSKQTKSAPEFKNVGYIDVLELIEDIDSKSDISLEFSYYWIFQHFYLNLLI